MKYISKITISMALAAGLVANCSKSSDGNDGGAKILLMSQQVASAASGGCAINVNLGGLYIGTIYNTAINTTTTFTQAKYETASGSTVTAQGFSSYAAVPYNRKYDAFIKSSGKNADLTSTKATIDAMAYMGLGASTCTAGGNSAAAATAAAAAMAGFRTASASVAGSLTTAEATAMEAVLTSAGTSSSAIEAAVVAGPCGGANAYGSTLTALGGATSTANVYGLRMNYGVGTAMMACTRIPRSSCNLGSVSTASRSAAIAGVVRQHEMFLNYSDCRKPTANFAESVLRYQTTGLPSNQTVSGTVTDLTIPQITSPLDTSVGFKIRGAFKNLIGNEGSTSSFAGNQIYAENAYPVSSALAQTASSFTALFPLTSGNAAYDTANWKNGGNISLVTVDSCEAIGLGSVGPIPVKSTDVPSTIDNKKNLTEAKEISYAFSDNAAVATAYFGTYNAAIAGVANITSAISGAATSISTDAIACNTAMRNSFTVSGALGGGKLPVLQVAFGDGQRTSLFTACLYGGTSATRSANSTSLGASVTSLNGITDCPATASTGATSFPKNGTAASFTTFPNN